MNNCNSIYPVFFLRLPKRNLWWMIPSPVGFWQWKKRGESFTAYLTEKTNLMALLTVPQKEDFIRRFNKLSRSDQWKLRPVFAFAWNLSLNRTPIIRIPGNLVQHYHFNPMADLVLDHVHHMTYIARRGTVSRNEEIGTVLANCADQLMKATWYKKCPLSGMRFSRRIKAIRFLNSGAQSMDDMNVENHASKEENAGMNISLDNAGLEQIEPEAFAGSDVSVVELPTGIQKIGMGAFRNCGDLLEVILPDSLLEIDDYAFDGCVNLRQIRIPDSVLRIGEGAFRGCSNLKSIHLPQRLFKVENEAFTGCSALEKVDLPLSLRIIGHSAFRDCCSIIRMTLPDGLRKIGWSAFQGCSTLETINIPESVIFLGLSVFADCVNLKTIRLPSQARIGEESFRNCSSLTCVEIPEGVEQIGMWCFAGCTGLKTLKFPSTLRSVHSFAFQNCRNLQEIDFLADDVSINTYAFEGCCRLPEPYRRDKTDCDEE